MANTVNDVMNVIASPDYGIKNIAVTNQEILAILSGTHNSKNNIHAIVDDVRSLLQKLVGATTEKKPIEVDNKTIKINHKNIQNILDETKGIRKSIDNLAKNFEKQGGRNMPTIAKLSDKASQKVADAMVKDIKKQKNSGGMTAIIDVFTKLKNISLKDIIFGKLKLNKISALFKNAKEDLKIKEKDLNAIIKFINAVPEMVKSLSKIGWRINIVIKNDTIKKLSDILVGKKSILTLSKTIEKNKKVFNSANKASKSIKELVSSLSKIMRKLVFASLWAKLASMGIKIIEDTLNKLIPLSKKLAKNEKDFKNASKAAREITVLTGNILVTSIFLTIAAVTGIPAILGALVVSVLVNTLVPIAEKLSRSNKHMSKAVSSSLMLVAFTGIMTVTSLALSAIAIMGIPALLGSLVVLGVVSMSIFTFELINKAEENILKGSKMMAIMSLSLLLFGVALGKITKATENVSFKQIGMITALTGVLAGCIAIMGIPTTAILIGLGAAVLGTMGSALYVFAKSLKMISDIGDVPENCVDNVINAMKSIGTFFKENSLNREALKSARRYNRMMRPFGKSVGHLAKLKKIGVIPMKLIYQTLDAMKYIGNYFTKNPIEKTTIKQARRYKRMLRPFGNAITHLAKLKEMGTIPMKLVEQTLSAMSSIASYYVNNPIKRKVIKQAKKYKMMMRPFGKTIGFLSKLKEMGTIPMKLVEQTLSTMSSIANYYKENPIERKVIEQARRYKRMLRPFGNAITHLAKLKEMGTIPMKLVMQAMEAMSIISIFYDTVNISRDIEIKSKHTEFIVDKFTSMTKEIQDKFTGIKSINHNAVESIALACRSIIFFYMTTASFKKDETVTEINDTIKLFADNIQDLGTKIKGYSTGHHDSVLIAIESMKKILKALKKNSLNDKQIIKAKKNISLLTGIASALFDVSKINPSDISSVGDSLTSALNGVNAVDITQVNAVTDMFNAFNGINKSENIINKFAESVNNFTQACKELMAAMGDNTNAINNADISNNENGSVFDTLRSKVNNFIDTGSNSNNIQQNNTNAIRIANVDEIAKTIAEKINGVLSVDVPDTQVQLLINGTGGNEWTITRY